MKNKKLKIELTKYELELLSKELFYTKSKRVKTLRCWFKHLVETWEDQIK